MSSTSAPSTSWTAKRRTDAESAESVSESRLGLPAVHLWDSSAQMDVSSGACRDLFNPRREFQTSASTRYYLCERESFSAGQLPAGSAADSSPARRKSTMRVSMSALGTRLCFAG